MEPAVIYTDVYITLTALPPLSLSCCSNFGSCQAVSKGGVAWAVWRKCGRSFADVLFHSETRTANEQVNKCGRLIQVNNKSDAAGQTDAVEGQLADGERGDGRSSGC